MPYSLSFIRNVQTALLILLSICLLPLSTFAANSPHAWYTDALESLNKQGILQGLTFDPYDKITRGEFVSLIYQSLNSENNSESNFLDVPKESPYYSAISALTELSIINGYDDNTFRPKNPLTRAQTAAIISNAYSIQIDKHEDDLPFADINENHWAYSFINALYHTDIVKGVTAQQYSPNQALTWAQAVVIVHRALQYEDLDFTPAEEMKILEVIPLSADGHFLEVTFNQPLTTIDKFQFNIYDSSSLQKHGIQEITLIKDGKKAIITMYQGAGLNTLRDYTIEFHTDGANSTYSYYQNEYIVIHNVTISAVNVKDRKITITDDLDKTMTLSVPKTVQFDFVDAYNREARIYHNSKGELTLYELTNTAKDVKKKNKFIKKYHSEDFILVEKIDNNIVSGINDELDLEDFDVLVKSHKMIIQEDIHPGDLLTFNSKEKVLEVCSNIVTGRIDKVYQSGIEIDGEVYDYSGYYVDKRRDLETFDIDIAEDLVNKKVILFLNIDDEIILVK